MLLVFGLVLLLRVCLKFCVGLSVCMVLLLFRKNSEILGLERNFLISIGFVGRYCLVWVSVLVWLEVMIMFLFVVRLLVLIMKGVFS